MLYDNTTIKGQWIEDTRNMTVLSKDLSRTVNNITMAMPHSGVIAAAREPLNRVTQPQDISVSVKYLKFSLQKFQDG